MGIDWDRLRANRVESSGTLDESTQFGCIGHAAGEMTSNINVLYVVLIL